MIDNGSSGLPLIPSILRFTDKTTGATGQVGSASTRPRAPWFDAAMRRRQEQERQMALSELLKKTFPSIGGGQTGMTNQTGLQTPMSKIGSFGSIPALASPAGQGLGMAASKLLQASGYSQTPITLGQALGAAGEAGIQTFNAAQAAQQKNRTDQMLMQLKMLEALKPAKSDQTALMQNLGAMGVDLSTPEGRKIGLEILSRDPNRGLIDVELAKMASNRLDEERKNLSEGYGQYQVLQQMEAVLKDPSFETGLGTEQFLAFQKFGNMLGILTPEETEQFNRTEFFKTLQAKIAPMMRPPGSGSTSDYEVRMFQMAAPSLGLDKKTNMLLIKGAMQAFEYNRRKYQFMEQYFAENKNLTGAEEEWDKQGIRGFQQVDIKGKPRDLFNFYKDGLIKEGDVFMDSKSGQFLILDQAQIDILEQNYGN